MHPFVEGFGLATLLAFARRLGIRGLRFWGATAGALGLEYAHYAGFELTLDKIVTCGAVIIGAGMFFVGVQTDEQQSVTPEPDRINPLDFD